MAEKIVIITIILGIALIGFTMVMCNEIGCAIVFTVSALVTLLRFRKA